MAAVMYAQADLVVCVASWEFCTEMMGKLGKLKMNTEVFSPECDFGKQASQRNPVNYFSNWPSQLRLSCETRVSCLLLVNSVRLIGG